jgi:hypothetical protein
MAVYQLITLIPTMYYGKLSMYNSMLADCNAKEGRCHLSTQSFESGTQSSEAKLFILQVTWMHLRVEMINAFQ